MHYNYLFGGERYNFGGEKYNFGGKKYNFGGERYNFGGERSQFTVYKFHVFLSILTCRSIKPSVNCLLTL
jgi:hypothetical protein